MTLKDIHVYHLNYDIKRKIVQFSSTDDVDVGFDEKKTKEVYRNELENTLNWKRNGRVHLLSAGIKVGADDILKRADEELKKLLTHAFHDVSLPDIILATQQQQSEDDVHGEDMSPKINAVKDDAGQPKWNWHFQATDSDTKCLLECIGTASIQCETLPEMVDSHMVRYETKCSITRYGDDCFADCRPCEREGAAEHFDGEFEYNRSGEDVMDCDPNNDDVLDIVMEMFDEHPHSNMGTVEIQAVEKDKEPQFPHNKQVVIRKSSAVKDGFDSWIWNFEADEEEYGCTLACQGSVEIVTKQSPNPNIPKQTQKRLQSAAKAAPGKKIMGTNIINM
mmetsp:Transcript_6469/g.14617  ORF Transcript_6469/g.14617 Transcript_6469/m.14617 type:complete len:335 (+) Transcript_6469:102-1106(+)